MKKSVRVIIAGVIIAVGGVIVILCALGASGWNLKQANNWQEGTVDFDEPISKLKLVVNCGQVSIKHGETNKIVVTYEYDSAYQPRIAMNDGVLNIETPEKHWYDTIQFGIWDAPSMQIEIPQDSEPQLDLKLNAGAVEIASGRWSERVSVKINAGTLTLGDAVTDELIVKLNAGKFDAGKITASKVDCNLNAGAFDAAEIVCRDFSCKLSAGSANVNKLDSNTANLHLSAGSAYVKMVGTQNDYNTSVSKSAGSCNISSNTSASATRTLTINLSAGSANVHFIG